MVLQVIKIKCDGIVISKGGSGTGQMNTSAGPQVSKPTHGRWGGGAH